MISWAVVVVVRMLALYSDDTSSKTCVYNFFVKFDSFSFFEIKPAIK